MERLKQWASRLKKQIVIVYLASKDHRVPWHTKILGLLVAAYAFSPIDLIPDFIPVLGYLDDVILVPLGVWIVLKLIPKPVLQELKVKAEEMSSGNKPKNFVAAAIIVLIWLMIIVGATYFILDKWNR
ncbi:YkvA family protein [Chungangia koreensis]|uniref:YkvA family protein n=1 Tax=Chungangia koreensis TaxID=752657 RepID=A0ABV8X4K0_9LACT